jgi:NAD(P)-dependent dehydrogenase (short-subunit alcohol dehydrogenase family)
VFCNVNVTDEASVDAGFAKARAAIGQERILINCAGTGNAIKTASRKEDGSSSTSRSMPSTDHPDQPGRHLPLHRQVGRRHDDAAIRWTTASAAPSSTPPRWRLKTARSARRPIPPRRAAWSA